MVPAASPLPGFTTRIVDAPASSLALRDHCGVGTRASWTAGGGIEYAVTAIGGCGPSTAIRISATPPTFAGALPFGQLRFPAPSDRGQVKVGFSYRFD
jgi:hypothetical protein